MTRNPKAEVEITAESKTLGAKLREARAKFSKFGGELRKEFMSLGGAQTISNLASSGFSSLGGVLADQARDVFAFNDSLVRLGISASQTPEQVAEMGRVVRSASNEVGLSANSILAGAQAYVTLTGNAADATASARTFARVAQATGSSVTDIATAAAAMNQQLGITPAQFEQAFSATAAAGKAGAIELKDVSRELSTILPQWIEFGNAKAIKGNVGALNELSAALQIVRRGASNASETTTNLRALLVSLIRNSAKLKSAGVNVYEKDGKTGERRLRNVLDIVKQIGASKLGKNDTKLVEALGSTEARAAFIQLRDGRGELEKIVEASGDASVIQKDLATYLESTGGRTATAFERAKNAIAEAFTPERIEAFTSAVEGLADKLGPLAKSAGLILDGYNALFNAGKAVRGFLTPDDSRLSAATPEEIQLESRAKGVSLAEAAQNLQAQRGRYLAAKRNISAAIIDDKTTPESNKRAVAAMISQDDHTGEGARLAGAEYLSAAKISPEDVAKIAAQVRAELIDARIAEGTARSSADPGAAFLAALRTAAPEIGRSMAQGMPPTVVKADGKAIVDVHRGASAHARRPGG